eukprot:COSAG01_NODE_26161_length_722_cov_0.924559_3_plen_98_part_01
MARRLVPPGDVFSETNLTAAAWHAVSVGLFDAPPGSFNVSKHAVNASTPRSMATAKQLVTDSAVLLKNSGGALPLLKSSAQAAHPSSGHGSGRAGVAV